MEKWLKEVEGSLSQAIEAATIGEIPSQNLYMIAPLIYSKRNNMNNDALIQEMVDENEEQVQRDWACDEGSRDQYKFHYVSSYFFCFVVAGKMEESKYDEIMEYITSVHPETCIFSQFSSPLEVGAERSAFKKTEAAK